MVGWCPVLPSKARRVNLRRHGQNRVKSVGVLLRRERVSVFTDTAQDDLKVAPKIQSNSVQTGVFEFGPVEVQGLADSLSVASAGPTSGGAAMAPPKNQAAIPETEEVTTFHDELPPVENATQEFAVLDSRLLAPVESEMSKDIKRFLARPVIVAETKILTTTPAMGVIYSENIPNNWLHTSGTNQVAMWQNKIEGFSVIRGTICIRVQINPQRFQQGRFMLVFFPQAQLDPNRANMALTQSLTLATQLPRVELDCAANSSCTLEIPYVSPVLGYNYISGEFGHGFVQLMVYSPLVDPGGTGDIGVTVWASWKDVELMFPCQPQAGGRGAIQEQEEGSFTKLFKSVSKTATVAAEIPVLSSIARPVSWAAGIGSKIASAFGWANPRDTQRANTMTIRTAPYMQNVDAIDESQQLAFTSSNMVQVLPGAFGTDKDELSIQHVVGRPAYIGQFTITTANAAGDTLWSQIINPIKFESIQHQATTLKTIYYPTPLDSIASLFTLWRGSTKFTFKFVKTEFHSTRVMLVFIPPQASSVSFAHNEYMFREIYDLRETNEITVTVPFVSSQQYVDLWSNDTQFNQAGALYMYLINELKAPPTVSDTVTVLVEVAGGEDTEFAVPFIDGGRTPGMYWLDTPPASLSTVSPGYRSLNQKREVFVYQALGTDNTQEQSLVSTDPKPSEPIGTSSVYSGGLAASAFCIGEKIISLRQVLKRATVYLSLGVANPLVTINGTVCNNITTTSATTYPVAGHTLDYWNFVAPMYMYRRGGVRLRILDVNPQPYTGTPNNGIYAVKLFTSTFNNRQYVLPLSESAVATSFISHAVAWRPVIGGIEVEVPYYAMTPIQVIQDMANYSNPKPMYWPYPALSDMLLVQFTVPETIANLQVWRQAADDTEFGYFIGTLPYMATADVTMAPNNFV